MPLEESERTPKDCLEELVSQIGDHPESRVAHQICPDVIADSFENRRAHQSNCHHRPSIVAEVPWQELMQINLMSAEAKEQQVARELLRLQHAVEDRLHQGNAEGVKQAHSCEQNHRA